MSDETNKELSPEEVKARRAEITKFYKEQIPHLKVQAEYERLMTEIEESRAKRVQAQGFLAEFYVNMEEEKNKEEQEMTNPREDFERNVAASNESTQKRKLKKVSENE
jgi:hypothetical protein